MKSTKKSLLLSTLSLMMCVAMLLGTTYAWFTDSVTSGKNIIKSGNLDIEMYYADGTKDPASVTWADASDAAIFDYDLWEPGYTDVKHIKIANVGTLALKYMLSLETDGVVSKLADVLDVYVSVGEATQANSRADLLDASKFVKIGTVSQVLASHTLDLTGNLMPKGSKDASGNDATYENTLTLAIKMQEEAGNEYKKLSLDGGFRVVVNATQYTYENDSFDNQYDKNSKYDVCEHDGGKAYTIQDGKLVTRCDLCGATIEIVDQEEYKSAATTEELSNLITSTPAPENAIIILPAATYQLPSGSAQSKNITFVGDKDTVLNICPTSGTLNYQNGAVLDFEGITVEAAGSGNFDGVAHAQHLTFKNCTITGKLTLYCDTDFINCKFTNKSDYAFWTWGAGIVNVEGCTFESGGKAINLYGGGSDSYACDTTLNIKDTTFNSNGAMGSDAKPAVQIGDDYGSSYELNMTNVTVTGHPETTSCGMTTNLFNNKKNMDTNHLSITINGTKVY